MFESFDTPWDLLNKAIPGSNVGDFEFDMPALAKSSDATGRRMVEGVASTPAKDLQKEIVLQKGIDLRYFLKHGYFNNDHKPGFENKVGQPTKAEIRRLKDKQGESVLGLWVEGYLWPKGEHKVADSIWELAKALKSANSDRCLGFSIQGKVLQRDGMTILKAWLQDVAITPSPVNTRTFMNLVEDIGKSWSCLGDLRDSYEYVCKSIDDYVFTDGFVAPDKHDIVSFYELAKSRTAKAFTAGHVKRQGGLVVVPESLEGTRKATFEAKKKENISKNLEFAYAEMTRRGYPPDIAYRAAVAVTARQILHDFS